MSIGPCPAVILELSGIDSIRIHIISRVLETITRRAILPVLLRIGAVSAGGKMR